MSGGKRSFCPFAHSASATLTVRQKGPPDGSTRSRGTHTSPGTYEALTLPVCALVIKDRWCGSPAATLRTVTRLNPRLRPKITGYATSRYTLKDFVQHFTTFHHIFSLRSAVVFRTERAFSLEALDTATRLEESFSNGSILVSDTWFKHPETTSNLNARSSVTGQVRPSNCDLSLPQVSSL
ncbi:hypothetical protein CROQUDRAFT_97385 [Cronartium quercuum f. sp. fusiforme G11]|uniref:Uncharacterized protein n=1 Tax=Cronartium quercuum f. sp. fusiforme G11 TaxID=708437 RepID=A0A9P6N9R1_9BASI|nr:hypothetical protein CROQUDRAFT_97385 [Cronartium quercuum f. sp. fusiforme G11]